MLASEASPAGRGPGIRSCDVVDGVLQLQRGAQPSRPETGVRMSDLGVMEGACCGRSLTRRVASPVPVQVRRMLTVPDWSQQRLDPTDSGIHRQFSFPGPLLVRDPCDCRALRCAEPCFDRHTTFPGRSMLHGLQVSFRTPWPVTSEPGPNEEDGKCGVGLADVGRAEDRTASSKGLEVRSKSNLDTL